MSEVWTTRRLLAWMTKHFEERGIEFPRLCGELLLAHVAGCERLRLYMDADRPASSEELARLREMVQRAGRHEPIAYLTGSAWFFGMELKVTRDTLIPRPATETLVQRVLQEARGREAGEMMVVDIGTGSGAIAIALAKQMKGARVAAVDISEGALAAARENAQKHGVAERIEFFRGDVYEALPGELAGAVDFVVSNPPYISDQEWEAVEENVKGYEPHSALRGGKDGLDVVRRVIAGAGQWLKPGGALAVEIAASQKESALQLARSAGDMEGAEVIADHEDFPRVLICRRRCGP